MQYQVEQQPAPDQETIDKVLRAMAEDQVRFLKKNYHMTAADIISLYTGVYQEGVTYKDAINTVATHRATAAFFATPENEVLARSGGN